MPRQKDLSHESGIHQSRISTFETPGAANITLETLAKIAAGLKVGVIVKFVPFTEMWQWDNGFVPATFNVRPRLDRDDTFLDPEYRLYNPQTGKLSGFRAKVDNRLVEKKEDLGQQKISAKSVHEDADEEMNAMGTAAGY
jgi:DNA-binding Xre family transcriptional regulator